MPTPTTIRNAIVTRLNTVTDVGMVHAFPKFPETQGELWALYAYTPTGKRIEIRGWEIERIATQETSQALGRFTVVHTWEIRGLMQIDDDIGTAQTFDDLIESIRSAFRADEDLGNTVSSTVVNEVAGIQLLNITNTELFDYRLHAAQMRLLTQHYE